MFFEKKFYHLHLSWSIFMKSNTINEFYFTVLLSVFLCFFGSSYANKDFSWDDSRDQCLLRDFPHESINLTQNRIFFMTVPRSGMHWTLYILQHFTKRPFSTCNTFRNTCNQECDINLPFIIHSHCPWDLINSNNHFIYPQPTEKDKLLVIVRNPLDSILRFNTSFDNALEILSKPFSELDWLQQWTHLLFINLEWFDIWPEKNRYLFYYEDLLDKTEEEIRKLLQFLEVSDNELDEFLTNLEEHKSTCKSYYDAKPYTLGGTVTIDKGRDFFRKGYTEDQLQILVDRMKEFNPELWDKYLKRYEL